MQRTAATVLTGQWGLLAQRFPISLMQTGQGKLILLGGYEFQ